ncbi:alcohol dehydrogenase catalytic domain-containing protein [Pseudomonas sp. LB3P14]
MSRIIGFTQYGGPQVLTYSDIDVPAQASDEVRIQVKAIVLIRAESMWRNGAYVEPVHLPARLGYESAGVVEAVDDKVNHVAVGDRVSTAPTFSQNYGIRR